MKTSSLQPTAQATYEDGALIVTDPSGLIIEWSPAATALYGWTAEDALGRSIYDMTVPEFTRKQAAEIMTQLMSGQEWSGRFVVRHRDGSAFRAEVIDRPLTVDGKVVAVHGWSRRLPAHGDQTSPILLASEEPSIADVMREVLLDAGYRVAVARDAQEALAFARDYPPLLVMFDYRMADLGGAEFYERLRSQGVSSPMILSSAWRAAAPLSEQLGIPFLEQPFDIDDLLKTVRGLVRAD